MAVGSEGIEGGEERKVIAAAPNEKRAKELKPKCAND